MSHPTLSPIHPVRHAIKVINETFGLYEDRGDAATLIDWRDLDDGLAINIENTGLDATDITGNATVHGALPRGYFLEAQNNGVLRLVRA